MTDEQGKREPDDYTVGYREGFVEGYEDGIEDGQMMGYADAKRRAFRAVDNDFEAVKSLEAVLGEL